MKKSGGFIPGIRPGKPTVEYLTKILNYIIFIGACGLDHCTDYSDLLQWMVRRKSIIWWNISHHYCQRVYLKHSNRLSPQMLSYVTTKDF